ncbi:uncharacterized protein BDW43DRAFT_259919 [Aspergillus alliaceus]|uniref:uncharacterized protein n=1 Tax=Petromyces alliaceus TaxID=209559 RepID=UPI0012A61063|nr:uncharacterized protein BDW43DRAFT_259919 [Aspergillus alliaceus]KAB8238844.1 hypothetical protein BDW43DRAFT_259919 [Aspergillus alliaceus]
MMCTRKHEERKTPNQLGGTINVSYQCLINVYCSLPYQLGLVCTAHFLLFVFFLSFPFLFFCLFLVRPRASKALDIQTIYRHLIFDAKLLWIAQWMT